MKKIYLIFIGILFLFNFCSNNKDSNLPDDPQTEPQDTLIQEEEQLIQINPEDLVIEKDFLYDQYTLGDTYPYKDTTRMFQWDKIREGIAHLENIQQGKNQWGILQNRRNINGEAPLVSNYRRNEYKKISDTLGVERHQSIPLFLLTDPEVPERYGRDGSLVKILKQDTVFTTLEVAYFEGKWNVPERYVKTIDSLHFNKVIFVDRDNQNIMTLEKSGEKWLVRSMNPATTGVHRPPYAQETPLGLFVIQEKKEKMFYLRDGTQEIAGFAPYASRFSNGGYIHGVPVNGSNSPIIEFSPTLGTIPRSHMCVRNASSHAKFIYDWAPLEGALVFVIE